MPSILLMAAEKQGTATIYSVGAGGGFEAGNGLYMGLERNAHKGHTTIGIIFDGDNAQWEYSFGLRYLRYLARGIFNDTYAWIGGARTGTESPTITSYIAAFGFGLGGDIHLGLPFRISIDSGYHITREYDPSSSPAAPHIKIGPTFNTAFIYSWH